MIHQYDVVVIGGGIAGLYAALTTAENAKVAVISTRARNLMAFGTAKAIISARLFVQRTSKLRKQF